MRVLVTGGAGYIGSHTVLELLKAGHEVFVVDNLSNSSEESLKRVERLTGETVLFYKVDIRNKDILKEIFENKHPDVVIHFAGLKAVGESTQKPLEYFDNNIGGTVALLGVMKETGCRKIVFSSSATVYGNPESVPIKEDARLSVTNPYGRTKLMIEQILGDIYASDHFWNVMILRYFNPVGAHRSGEIGEDPNGIPNNLMPYIAKVAAGQLEKITVFGNDYNTPDGTGVRDYIHVTDLAIGHVKAIERMYRRPGFAVYNLGTGTGYSVLEIIQAYSRACGRNLPYVIGPRRPGDIDACYADPSLAAKELDWRAVRGIDEMCADSWNWQSKNPQGYR